MTLQQNNKDLYTIDRDFDLVYADWRKEGFRDDGNHRTHKFFREDFAFKTDSLLNEHEKIKLDILFQFDHMAFIHARK